MSVIEKLDSVLAKFDENSLGNASFLAASATFIRDHGPAIRQDMIDAERYRWLRESLGTEVSHWFCTEGGDELDAAIDARLASEREGLDTPTKPRYNCPTEAHDGEE